MGHTKLDEIMLEMIQPKMDEINVKFSTKQPLDSEDINTLLIKAQFNHIEHLDLKLDEVTASVVSLEGKFFHLENSVNEKHSNLENKFHNLENKFHDLEKNVNEKISNLDKNVNEKISNMENKFHDLDKNVNDKISILGKKVDGLSSEIKIVMKEAVITNMKFTLGTIGLIAAVFKVLDIYKL